ncbi:hypothetical protein [Noviherbaspirillum soli]|uniref:hypothetical protein n=1 Tax=Noviherbaspirillum soli TaxID=1064518 RepID=UPI00188D75C9|nr:hypothetical protein [Noviherbaspirillum soli]
MATTFSAVTDSRTSVPQNKQAVNAESLLRGTDSYSSRIPDVLLMHERIEPRVGQRNISDLLAQERSGEGWDKIRSLATHQARYTAPVLNMPDVRLDIDAAVSAHASALMVTDERAAANCCGCLPCNLL